MTTICCKCRTLISADDRPGGVSHGYCRTCCDAEITEIKRRTAERARADLDRDDPSAEDVLRHEMDEVLREESRGG